jgi:hypothetical protein
VLKEAIPALEFKWRLVAHEYQVSATGPGRRRAIEAYLTSLAAWIGQGVFSDSIQLGLLVNQLSQLLCLPGSELTRQLSVLTRRTTHRPAAAPVPQGSRYSDQAASEQEAIRQILEVLLNEPAYYSSVAGYLDLGAIRSPELAMLAQQLVAILEEGEPFLLSDLIGRFELPAFGGLITDLQERGERRGRYEEVIAGCIQCLESFRQARRTTRLAAEIRGQRAEPPDDAEPMPLTEDDRLLALAASARNPHFASPRARRRFLE